MSIIEKPSELSFTKYSKSNIAKEQRADLSASFLLSLILALISLVGLYYLQDILLFQFLFSFIVLVSVISSIMSIFEFFTNKPKCKLQHKDDYFSYLSNYISSTLGEFYWIRPPLSSDGCIIAYKDYLVFVNLTKDTITYIPTQQITHFQIGKEHLGAVTTSEGHANTIGIDARGFSAYTQTHSSSSTKNIYNNYLEIITNVENREYIKFNFLEHSSNLKVAFNKMSQIMFQ